MLRFHLFTSCPCCGKADNSQLQRGKKVSGNVMGCLLIHRKSGTARANIIVLSQPGTLLTRLSCRELVLWIWSQHNCIYRQVERLVNIVVEF